MKYYIASDIPGRIRLRYGRNAFTARFESAIAAYFASLPYVEAVKVCYHTGSALLFYDKHKRNDLLTAAQRLLVSSLAPVEHADSEHVRLIDDSFKKILISSAFWQLFRRYLLPSPIRQIVTLIRAFRFIKKGWECLRKRRIGVEMLDASAVAVSLAQGNFNTASSIMFLLNLSEILEEHTRQKTKSMLAGSLLVHTDSAWVERSDGSVQIPVSELKLGDLVIVRTGVTIPVDGTVRRGEAVVNQSAMTGEPLGVFKKEGDSVFAGSVVEDGRIFIEVRALENETRISQIVDMISESESLKASIQSKAERIADKIVPFSFLLSLGVLALTRSLTKALSVLLVDYSCAIKLATPISVISAMQEAATRKIIVKGGKFFESLAEADTVVFDKTGTLTLAKPTVRKVVSVSEYSRDEVLRIAACIEEHFPHSMAQAIVRAAQAEGLEHEEMHTEVEYIVAHGIATSICGKRAVIGSHHFLFEDERIPLSAEQQKIMNREIASDSAIYLAVDGELIGFICINDPPRPEAAETVRRLRELGIRDVIMLTGDGEAAAELVSRQLGINRYHAQILPQDKANIINAIKAEGKKVIMVGDGINDTPALAAADVSISMQDSSDLAREVSDVTLLSSDLSQLVTSRILAQRLMRRIQRNFHLIVSVNTALLAMGIGNVLTPGAMALLHNTSTIAISAAATRRYLPAEEAPDLAAAVMES